MHSAKNLATIAIPGLTPDSFGNYLASLGLARVLSRAWPSVRIAWNHECLYVVGGPPKFDTVIDALMDVAERNAWTPYDRAWLKAQKLSTKRRSTEPFDHWSAESGEDGVRSSTAHIVSAGKLLFNPILGKGGSAGKRSFSHGWKRATDELRKSESMRMHSRTFLLAESGDLMLKGLNAASWFSKANKTYNSGQDAYREGVISPWAMALACEGILFFAGAVSRRLGARARLRGAFPFVVSAPAPTTVGENGRDIAEVWVPLWKRPMTTPEISALFLRGRAEQNGRGALTPAAFAVAIYRRGVDAGIAEFKRFTLGRTTSSNTFEPRLSGSVRLDPTVTVDGLDHSNAEISNRFNIVADGVVRILELLNKLPRDTSGDKPRFFGLRGPLEKALLAVTESPDDNEIMLAMLDATVSILDRIDHNKNLRERDIIWRPLPLEWLNVVLDQITPTTELRLATSMVSTFPTLRPFTLYRFGAESVGRKRFRHPESAPKQWAWSNARIEHVLSNILMRRVLDWESDIHKNGDEACAERNPLPAMAFDVNRWLLGETDDTLLIQWLSRMALFDWTKSSIKIPLSQESTEPDAALLLFGLLRPLFDTRPINARGNPDLLPKSSGARTPGAARAMIGAIRGRNFDGALRMARSRYAMADVSLVKTNVPWNAEDLDRLLSSMNFAIPNHELSRVLQQWLAPRRDS